MTLLYNTLNVGKNSSSSFVGTGGTSPYTYSVLAGGAGGSIDANGLYTAPSTLGKDTIQAQDSLGAIAQQIVFISHPIQLVMDIIRKEMMLSPDQIYFYSQKIKPITDSRIYIAVGVLLDKPFGSSNKFNPIELKSEQYVNFKSTLSIDILSRDLTALFRKEEILLALASNYAENQQKQNSFHIAKIATSFVNLSQDEGASIPYRFNIAVNIQYAVTKTEDVGYFDTFLDPTITINK